MNPGPVISLAWASLNNRRGSALLTVLAVAVAVMLFLGVDKLRQSAQESFRQTISGTDLIVAARTSPVSVILFSVFHIGDPPANVSWESYEWIAGRSDVAWAVPIALGDNHEGYRVVGTTSDFFTHYQFRRDSALSFAEGREFENLFDVVVGASVAKSLQYSLGSEIILNHGGGHDFSGGHDNLPFTISGILAPTGTPIDQSVFVSLPAIEAIHVGWESGAKSTLVNMITPERVKEMDLQPDAVSAIFIGLSGASRNPFLVARAIDTYPREALIAAKPGLATAELWNLIGVAENALLAVSALVILVGLVSILTSIMTSVRERRREMAVLRAVGAGPKHIMGLIISEAALLAAFGSLIGIALTYLVFLSLSPLIEARFGIRLDLSPPGLTDLWVFTAVTGFAALLGVVPALVAMKNSLSDGLSIKL